MAQPSYEPAYPRGAGLSLHRDVPEGAGRQPHRQGDTPASIPGSVHSLSVYDNQSGTARAYLSIARKRTQRRPRSPCCFLPTSWGPEGTQNGRIVSGARSRKQAAEVFNYASKMVMMSPELSKLTRIVPSSKMIVGLAKNVQYQAISAEAKGAHGGSPILAILARGWPNRGVPTDAFVEAVGGDIAGCLRRQGDAFRHLDAGGHLTATCFRAGLTTRDVKRPAHCQPRLCCATGLRS